MIKSKVAVLKTSPATVVEDYQRLVEMAGMKNFLDPSRPTILKDNISWHYMMPGANTTPWQLEGTILGLQNAGFKDLVCVENETVVTNAKLGEKLNKFEPVLHKYNIPVKYNFLQSDMQWVKYKPRAKMLVLDKIYRDGICIPDFFFNKNIVHLPTMKCHIYTTTTGAMKNAFGGLLNTRRHYTHSVIHETLVDLLHIQKEIHSGIFAVMDGTTAGNGPGPRTMKPEVKNYILASSDCVAIDAVAAKMMGFDPMSLPYIALADNAGLGNGRCENIEVLGENVSGVSFRFSVGDNFASKVGDMMWFGPLKFMQRLMFHTPLVYVFVFGSFFYHDYIWHRVFGKAIVKKWMRSGWGELFQKY
jgi:uncharacterized protein (DUF362 family)